MNRRTCTALIDQRQRIASQDGTGPPLLNTAGGTQTLVTPYAADDDGGYFRGRAWRYYQDGAMLLAAPPTVPSRLRIVCGNRELGTGNYISLRTTCGSIPAARRAGR